MNKLGERIRALREARGLSQVELDERAGLHRRTTGHYESGRRAPTVECLLKIAGVLQADLYWLLDVTKPRLAGKVYKGELWADVHTGTQTRRIRAGQKSTVEGQRSKGQ